MNGYWILVIAFVVLGFICYTVWFFIVKAADRVNEDHKRKNAVNKEEDLMSRYKK